MRDPRSSKTGRFVFALVLLLVGGFACTAEMKARAYAGDDRDAWQQPERVIEVLEIEPGQRVADLGSGGGYFTFRLADAVGEGGQVFAVDVDPAMNERLDGLAAERGVDNITVVLAGYEDPKIPEPVDLIFTSNTYHHIEGRVAYFERAARYLAPGARLAVLDYKRQGFMHRIMGHATASSVIRDELEQAGYTFEGEHDFVEKQHFLVFGRPQFGRP